MDIDQAHLLRALKKVVRTNEIHSDIMSGKRVERRAATVDRRKDPLHYRGGEQDIRSGRDRRFTMKEEVFPGASTRHLGPVSNLRQRVNHDT
jgi:hypothetical protein